MNIYVFAENKCKDYPMCVTLPVGKVLTNYSLRKELGSKPITLASKRIHFWKRKGKGGVSAGFVTTDWSAVS